MLRGPGRRCDSRSVSEAAPAPTTATGVLAVLRAFTFLQLAVLGATGLAYLGHRAPEHAPLAIGVMCALLAALGAVLARPVIARPLRDAHLAAALLVAAAFPIAGELVALRESPVAYEKLAVELALAPVVPLVISSWRFGWRPSVAVAVGLGAAELLLSRAAPLGHAQAETYLHVLVARTAALVLAGYVVARLAGEQRAQHEALRRAHVALARSAVSVEQLAVTRERNRIARELHDTLAHTLTGTAVQLEALRARWSGEPADARPLLDRALATARAGLAEVRRGLHALRAAPLEALGPALAIAELARGVAQRAGLALDLRVPDGALDLPPEVAQGAYRIAQEALENVARHADARRVSVTLAADGGRLTLDVADDGRGFDPARTSDASLGLRGMRERAAMLGGALEVESGPSRGTRLRLAVDLAPAAPAEGAAP